MPAKHKLVLFISIFLIFCIFISGFCVVFAHSGDTDAQGGHYDYSTSEYHYHHGHPAHQHKNGNCPYEKPDFPEILSKILIFIVGALAIPLFSAYIFGMIGIVIDKIISKFKKKGEDITIEPIEEKDEKVSTIISILLYIIELIIWLIIVINM